MISIKGQADIRRKLKVLNYAKKNGNVSKTCRYFGISRETLYKWKRDYEANGESAFMNSKPCPQNPKLRIPADIEEKIIIWANSEFLGIYRDIIISKYTQLEYGMYLNVMDLINFLTIKGSGHWRNLSDTKSRYLHIESKLM